MKKMNKPKKQESPFILEVLKGISPLDMEISKVKMQLAARIEDLILSKGWSKKIFAEKLGKNPSEITKWLSGTHNFTLAVITEICVVLEVEFTELFEKEKVHYITPKEIKVKQNASEHIRISANGSFKEIDKQHTWVCTIESTTEQVILESYDYRS